MAGKGGGAWKVAYADFVTAMMAFFMVMWLTSQDQEVKEAIAEHFRNPSGKHMTGTDGKSLTANPGSGGRRTVKARNQNNASDPSQDRKMTDEGSQSNKGRIIRFELNSLELSPDGKEALKSLVPDLAGPQYRIEVRGHSANNGGNAIQSAQDAWVISFRRAMVVTQYLLEQGVDPRRIRPSAAGHSEPSYRDDRVAAELDARVEVFVLADVFEDPASRTERANSRKKLNAEADDITQKEEAAAAAEQSTASH